MACTVELEPHLLVCVGAEGLNASSAAALLQGSGFRRVVFRAQRCEALVLRAVLPATYFSTVSSTTWESPGQVWELESLVLVYIYNLGL